MATRTVLLPLTNPLLPDDSNASNRPPAPVREISVGTPPSNAPKVTQLLWKFDDSTDEHLFWSFVLPGDYASGGTLRLKYKMATATANDVVLKAALAPVTDSSTDDDALVFNAVSTATSTVPSTQGQVKEATVTPSATGLAASRKVVVMVGRDANAAADTATGDLVLVGAVLEYET